MQRSSAQREELQMKELLGYWNAYKRRRTQMHKVELLVELLASSLIDLL
jgi:hypothetical protein